MQNMNKAKKLLALLLALAMVFALAACGSGNTSTPASSGSNAPASDDAGSSSDTPLVVGYSPFSSKFSPFFAETSYDLDAQQMTQLNLLSSDRTGAIIYNGIEGETIEYNGTDYTYYGPADLEVVENEDGTVDYNFTLRDDLTFSDGTPVTIDDVIFSMYVLCDPTYDGSSTLYAQPIEGMEEYRQNNTTLAALLAQLGEDNTDFTYVTEEQQTAFWDAVNNGLVAFAQEIVDYCIAEGINAEGDSVAACAANWGYTLDEGATVKDFAMAIGDNYGWNFSAMEAETAGSALSDLIPEDVYAYSTTNVATGESAPNISGIIKTGDYTMTVHATKVDATMIYQLAVAIAPMHYYGDESLYDYDNNSFGFPKGDLSSVRAKTTEPMGAGPYKFLQFSNGVINFEANENYYLGAPKTKYINFQEVQEADKLNGVITGTLDLTDPSFNVDTADAVEQANGGELTGDVLTTETVDFLGYGYIGINSHTVSVGGVPDSDASKDLRKAFATIFSVYRDVAIDSYYGEIATIINYPISNTSWAAPRATDADYKVAFSTDVNGNDIYTSDMTADQKYEAAKQAALGYFEAAGYTVEGGKVVAAPEGASMEYEVQIPADGSGNHPCFMILTLAKDALAELGINLIVTDLTNSTDLWTALEAGTCEMWCAAWGATVDPDMYQIYYSDVANGGANAGGSNYMYQIADPELDQMILDARASTDQTYRKAMYKACLDIVIDWACEVPVYQRKDAFVFSTERVNMDTVAKDITPFYKWLNEVDKIELN